MDDNGKKELIEVLLPSILAAIEAKEKAKTPYWTVERIGLLLGVIATFVTSMAGLAVGLLNKDRNEQMLVGQHAAVAVAEDVKTKLDDTTTKQEKSLNKLQRSAEAVEDSQGPQLWLTWKRLEEDATYARDNGLVEDAKAFDAKAKDAKAKFDAHAVRQKNGKN